MENNENTNEENADPLEVQSSSDAENQGGWIRIWRKIMENDIWINKPATWLKLWMLMLMKANYEDGNIKRGQVLLNYSIVKTNIPDMTYGAFRSALSWLKRTAIIHTHRRTRLVLITILNYNTYQRNVFSNNAARALPQRSHSDRRALPQRSISKEERIKKEESIQEVPPGLKILSSIKSPCSLNGKDLNRNDLNGILSHNAEDSSRPANAVISSPPATTPGDLTNPAEFISYFYSAVKASRAITINPKDEDLLYANKTVTSVPGEFRTTQTIEAWVTWYLSEYLSQIQSPSAEYFRITTFSASWEMFYIRKLSNKPIMTLEAGNEPNESTELLQQPEVFIKSLREAIQEHRSNITLPDDIRAIDIVTAGCIYDILKIERCYTSKHLHDWVQYYAICHLRDHPIKPGQHNRYIMHFRGSWEEIKRYLPSPVSFGRSNDMDSNNLMPRISRMLVNGVTDETILKSMGFFGLQVTANYLQYKLHQDNSETRIGSILNGIYNSTDANKWNILLSIYNSTMKFSPKEFMSDKILLSNWRTKNIKQWALVLKDEHPGNHDILYRSEFELADEFYEELLGKPDTQPGKN